MHSEWAQALRIFAVLAILAAGVLSDCGLSGSSTASVFSALGLVVWSVFEDVQ